MKVVGFVLALFAVTTAYELKATCPVCCNIGQDPTNFAEGSALRGRCDGANKGEFIGCCKEVGHCCPAILGFPSKLYLCCNTGAKEVCKNSYEPQCYIPAPKQTASDLYCAKVGASAPSGTCWRRCGLQGKACTKAAPVVAAPVQRAAPAYTYSAPAYNFAPAQPAYNFAPATPLYGASYSQPMYSNLLRQYSTFSPYAGYNSLSYGLNYPSPLPALNRAVAPQYTYSQPTYNAPVVAAPVVAAPAPAPACDESTSCSCDDACTLRGDCCFDFCAFCVSK